MDTHNHIHTHCSNPLVIEHGHVHKDIKTRFFTHEHGHKHRIHWETTKTTFGREDELTKENSRGSRYE